MASNGFAVRRVVDGEGVIPCSRMYPAGLFYKNNIPTWTKGGDSCSVPEFLS